ncbi:hypothetical protein [Massilia sp. HP4]|uniref:hypothetical protein n=1 Tax=Massilia sp. HP4 TaxID=2562316 RepID=UPI0010C0D7CF|nr:hypothetical protein [Massilia sp. HP4]
MFKHTAAPWRAAALLAASLAAMPAIAQSTADDPAAAVPETRYEPAHVQRAPAAPAATPDRKWQESNRIVASQPAHGAHVGHAGHAGHAKPADKPALKADPHEHHHHHEGHH